jgi:hypothetical protein
MEGTFNNCERYWQRREREGREREREREREGKPSVLF